jgi:hypothetical protein
MDIERQGSALGGARFAETPRVKTNEALDRRAIR